MASGNSYKILESIYKYFPQENKLWKIKIGPINTQELSDLYTYLAAIVLSNSSLIARLTSALCLSIGMFKTLLRSFMTFRLSFVNSPWARSALKTDE